jgi:hypothetical protein
VSNPQHIHVALAALAPSGRTFYNDEAPGDGVAPWLVGSLEVPESLLGLSARSYGGVARFWVTVAAATGGQARVVAQEAIDAWQGARVSVPGYVLGSLAHRYSNGPYPAGLTATDTDLRFQVVRLGFDLTASRIPAP